MSDTHDECQCCGGIYAYGDGETRKGPEKCEDCRGCCGTGAECHLNQRDDDGADLCSECGWAITPAGEALLSAEHDAKKISTALDARDAANKKLSGDLAAALAIVTKE